MGDEVDLSAPGNDVIVSDAVCLEDAAESQFRDVAPGVGAYAQGIALLLDFRHGGESGIGGNGDLDILVHDLGQGIDVLASLFGRARCPH